MFNDQQQHIYTPPPAHEQGLKIPVRKHDKRRLFRPPYRSRASGLRYLVDGGMTFLIFTTECILNTHAPKRLNAGPGPPLTAL